MNRRIGDEIKDIVQKAVNTKDFRQLNRDIGNTVNSALGEVRKTFMNPGNRRNWCNPDNNQTNRDDHRENTESADSHQYHRGQADRQYNNYNRNNSNYYNKQNQPYSYSNGNNQNVMNNQPVREQNRLYPIVPVGRASGILLTVFGNLGIGIIGLAILTLCLFGQLTDSIVYFGTIALFLLPFLCISIFMSIKGSQIRKRLKRFKEYLGIFQSHSYCTIKELSTNLAKNSKFIIKDLRNMISKGMFPEGHIDQQETCIMLNRESYNKYLELQNNISQQKANLQEQTNGDETQKSNRETPKTPSAKDPLGEELRAAARDGRAYIRQIKEANDAIQGEEISKKLSHLEEIIEKIFNYVELHPDQFLQIQQFMNYYLPTTLKLVNTYKDFDKESVQGENITSAKNEIDLTLDTINLAFEKLYDSFFLNAAMDISTDISVLETLLAQEGLTQKDFKSNLSMGGLMNE